MKKFLLVFMVMLLALPMTAQTSVTEASNSIEEVLLPYVTKILKAAETGATFIADETPIVLTQYILFNAFVFWIWSGIGILLIVFYKQLGQRLFCVKSETKPESVQSFREYVYLGRNKWLNSHTKGDISGEQAGYIVFKWGSVTLGLILFFVFIFDAVKATFFPKLFLVEKFLELI
tara:strand:+ start:11452 stop:11979 length:528 start_codon:yes stop_codon:yes gene_type:complete